MILNSAATMSITVAKKLKQELLESTLVAINQFNNDESKFEEFDGLRARIECSHRQAMVQRQKLLEEATTMEELEQINRDHPVIWRM